VTAGSESADTAARRPAAILDVDGTLVDTNYLHVVAWKRAFRRHDVDVPGWRVHRHVGMGGDQLVAAVAGDEVEERDGDAIRDVESELYRELIDEAELLPGARELIAALKDAGHAVILASSAKEQEVDHYLDMLGARDLADGWTTSADVEATKPHPELIDVAMEKAGTREAVMVGDSRWDCEAANRAGVPSIGLLTGGFSEDELLEAGAVAVYESCADLVEHLDETPFGKPAAA
jgi:HAD superfamily hydrolase (TIGR01509 family)